MPLKCVFCGAAHLPSESCGRDTEGGLARGPSARLDQARAVLSAASERVGAKVAADPPLPLGGQHVIVDDGYRSLQQSAMQAMQAKEVMPLQNPVNPNSLTKAPADGAVRSGPQGFDRAAYHKAYMKTYMQTYRARRKGTK